MPTAHNAREPDDLEGRLRVAGVERSSFVAAKTLRTGIALLDEALEGGLRSGMLTEIATPSPSSGGQSLMIHLLNGIRREGRFAALVDAAGGFDPQSAPPALLEHLLWVRPGSPLAAMKVADVLLRDENFGLAVVDLRGCDERRLRGLKSADWYRLQRLAEQSGSYFCVFTPRSMIPSAQARIELGGSLSWSAAEASLAAVGARLSFEILRFRKREAEGFPNLIKRRAGEG